MITVGSIRNIQPKNFDHTYAIVRSYSRPSPGIEWMPELSPDQNLYRRYLDLRNKGQWGKDSFASQYLPTFLNDMTSDVAREKLSNLYERDKAGENIALVCFCDDESLCHRSIVAGMLKGAGCEVRTQYGDGSEYAHYYNMWQEAYARSQPQHTIQQTPVQTQQPIQQTQQTAPMQPQQPQVKAAHYPSPLPVGAIIRKDGTPLPPPTGMSICFTGPRPKQLHGYSEQLRDGPYKDIVSVTQNIVEQFADMGYTRFINGGAQGFDQLAGWAVNHARKNRPELENVMYIPFENQPSQWMSGMFGKNEYDRLKDRMDGVKACSPNPPAGDKYAAAKFMHERNHHMVNSSDLVIALLADRSLNYETAEGGTAECVRYALKHGKPVYAIEYHPELEPSQRFQGRYLPNPYQAQCQEPVAQPPQAQANQTAFPDLSQTSNQQQSQPAQPAPADRSCDEWVDLNDARRSESYGFDR